MKTFFAADLHGKEIIYQQMDEYIRTEKPDIIILGGDLYPEARDVQKTPENQSTFCKTHVKPRFEKYRSQGVQEIYVIMGNHDLSLCEGSLKRLEEEFGLCKYIHNREVKAPDGTRIVGYSFSPPSPYILRDFDKKDSPDEEVTELCLLEDNRGYIYRDGKLQEVNNREFFESRNTIQEDLGELEKNISGDGYIFVCHAPPLSEYLDLETPLLHVGSRAIRDFIQRTKPYFSLHGHIHFSPKNSGQYMETIEGTPCVQPGQKFNNLHAVLFDTEAPEKTVQHTVFQ